MSTRWLLLAVLAGALLLPGLGAAADEDTADDATAGQKPVAAEQSTKQSTEKSTKKSKSKPEELSPEDVARRFFAALLTRDEAEIKRYSIPSPGSEILWKGAPLNDAMRAAVKERMASLKFRRLKAGDTVTSPAGKQYTVDPTQVNEGRVLLLPEGFKLPFTLVDSDLGWRVKVDGLIAARKAAEEQEQERK